MRLLLRVWSPRLGVGSVTGLVVCVGRLGMQVSIILGQWVNLKLFKMN
jgi:hypothetical protein